MEVASDPTGKQAFVTGVSRGIGRGLAEELLSRGWNVCGISRSVPEPFDAEARFRFCRADVSSPEQLGSAISKLGEGVKTWDLVVLNAGQLGSVGDIGKASLDEMRQVMDVNVWSIKRCLDLLFETGLSIPQVVAISSGASRSGSRGFSGYAVSKAALNMLVSLYAKEFPKTHFCSFAPGVVDTGMQETLSDFKADERYESIKNLQAMRESHQMWTPQDAGPILVKAMLKLPEQVASGEFADVRDERFHDTNPGS